MLGKIVANHIALTACIRYANFGAEDIYLETTDNDIVLKWIKDGRPTAQAQTPGVPHPPSGQGFLRQPHTPESLDWLREGRAVGEGNFSLIVLPQQAESSGETLNGAISTGRPLCNRCWSKLPQPLKQIWVGSISR